MRLLGPLDSLHVGVQFGSTFLSKSSGLGLGYEPWGGGDRSVSCLDLRPCPCLGLDQCTCPIGTGCRRIVGHPHDVVERKNASSLGFGGFGASTNHAKQRVSKRLLCLDFAKLGARSIHSISWPDSMDGMAMAFCPVGFFDAKFVSVADL